MNLPISSLTNDVSSYEWGLEVPRLDLTIYIRLFNIVPILNEKFDPTARFVPQTWCPTGLQDDYTNHTRFGKIHFFFFSEVLTSRHVKENPDTFLGLAFLFHGRAVLLCPKTWRIGRQQKYDSHNKKNPRKCCKGRKTPTNQTRLVVFVGFLQHPPTAF